MCDAKINQRPEKRNKYRMKKIRKKGECFLKFHLKISICFNWFYASADASVFSLFGTRKDV